MTTTPLFLVLCLLSVYLLATPVEGRSPLNGGKEILSQHHQIVNVPKSSSPGSFYWYGTDIEGSPILWYLADQFDFKKANVKDDMDYSAHVIDEGLKSMPTKSQGMIFVICFDKFDTLKAIKRPNLAPAFIRTFMKSLSKASQEQGGKEATQEQFDLGKACQGEAGVHSTRLKKAYFVTGTIGHIFYKLAKSLAPTHITDRIVEVRSREDAARLLVKDGVIEEKNIPTFLGGSYLQDEITRKEYYTMMKAITKEMRTKAENLPYHW